MDEETVVEETPESVAPTDTSPVEAPPDPAAEVARLREENARLSGENRGLRETRQPHAEPSRPEPARTGADPFKAEFDTIEALYAAGTITDAERTMRLGSLGAEATIARREQEQRAASAKQRAEQARQKSGQKISAYLQRHPGLQNPNGAEMQRVAPHLRAVCDELDLPDTDERAQALALERTFGPIDRSPHVDTREFERIRHPGGGGGGTFAEEPPQPPTPKSKGQRLWDALTPESQAFFVSMRGSKDAAIKTPEDLVRTIARLERIGLGGIWGNAIDQDMKNSEKFLLYFFNRN